jgi:peptidoglycan/LPS O-acetylase OafA/YrhL
MTYRPEIDGLRAIAIVAVLIYHAGFNIAGHVILPGGYVGVDVFFVISGYLITSIMRRELDATGTFSFTHFYLRRARRILPALVLVILCTTLIAFALMRFEALREYYSTALAALWSFSNFVFWQQDGYYAAPSELKPLLHTWSLGIEEQFYLLFPILLVLLYRFARHYVVPAILVLTLASLSLAHYGSRHFPDASFFLLPTRAWELLTGALLAFMSNADIAQPRSRQALLAGVGLVLIAVSLLVFGRQTQHPSLLTLLPVAGAALVIRFGGSDAQCATTRVLRSKPLVGIGLISYGLYLWHFPLFALYRYELGEPSAITKFALLMLTMLLALVSFFTVEKPLRFSGAISGTTFLKGMALAIVVLSGTSAIGYGAAGKTAASLLVANHTLDLDAEKQKRFARISEDCTARGWDVCDQAQDGVVNVLVVGDSLVDDAYNILDESYPDYRFIRSTFGGCPPYPDIVSLLQFELPGLQDCLALNRARFTPGSLAGIDGVVIDNHYLWFTPEDLKLYLDFLRAEGVKNILLLGNYISLKQNMAESFSIFTSDDAYADLVNSGIIESEFIFEDELTALAKTYGAEFVSLKQAACDEARCTVFAGGYPYSWDQWHFSLEFSSYLATALAPQLRKTWLNGLHKPQSNPAGS